MEAGTTAGGKTTVLGREKAKDLPAVLDIVTRRYQSCFTARCTHVYPEGQHDEDDVAAQQNGAATPRHHQ